MLTTIIHGKAGRVRLPDSGIGVSWRDIFRKNEDLLTGTFFGRIRYLSEPALELFMGQLIGAKYASELGALEDIEFWPHLSGLEGRSWVEPDVLIEFEEATLLIEVKPPFGGEQSTVQWRAQIGALLAECKQKIRETAPVVHYVALGRNRSLKGEISMDFGEASSFFDLVIHCREWEDVFDSIPQWIEDGQNTNSSIFRTDISVFSDLLESLDLFEMNTRQLKPWNPLAEWAGGFELSTDVLEFNFPVDKRTVSVQVDKRSDWARLVDYSLQHPMEKLA